jgi:hypothetical protein
LITAQNNMKPAKLNIGYTLHLNPKVEFCWLLRKCHTSSLLFKITLWFSVGQLWGVTHNRRAGLSPYVTQNSIDPNLGVIRIDDLNGNFDMHTHTHRYTFTTIKTQ